MPTKLNRIRLSSVMILVGSRDLQYVKEKKVFSIIYSPWFVVAREREKVIFLPACQVCLMNGSQSTSQLNNYVPYFTLKVNKFVGIFCSKEV